jgi:hypothetical protein
MAIRCQPTFHLGLVAWWGSRVRRRLSKHDARAFSLLGNTPPTRSINSSPATVPRRNRTSLPEKTPDTQQMPTESLVYPQDATSTSVSP